MAQRRFRREGRPFKEQKGGWREGLPAASGAEGARPAADARRRTRRSEPSAGREVRQTADTRALHGAMTPHGRMANMDILEVI